MNKGDNLNEMPPARLTPSMASFRLLVLDFVRQYLSRWGQAPSYSEIAAGLGADRSRVRHAVKKLVRQGLLMQAPHPRGLSLPEDMARAIDALRSAGWTIDAGSKSATNAALPGAVVLDYASADDSQASPAGPGPSPQD